MKKGLTILILALLGGVLAFCLMRSHKMAERQETLLDSMPELSWLRSELKLSDDQFARVSELHAAYRPKCMEMCQRIAAARSKVETLARASREVSPELEAALKEHAETDAQCRRAMVQHMYETAAVLDSDQAARYLETMLPLALEGSHGDPHGGH
ncbi:periplasmic heavy metal sensor [Haloferula sp. BvORR071]|uniref:periplasmic heavy metal sensor n=1 Tax=Haloferula sp. BvORR071 TaxID=1396141 RepID=UPI000551FEE5|nr:periplasmic heavy metal sensor [Haloferula sp. BvORR071]